MNLQVHFGCNEETLTSASCESPNYLDKPMTGIGIAPD